MAKMTQEDARKIVRRRLADQMPHLFPPNPPRDVYTAQASVTATEESSYNARRGLTRYRICDLASRADADELKTLAEGESKSGFSER